MNAHRQRKARLRREWTFTTVVALGLLALLIFADMARPLGNVVYDHFMRWEGFRSTQTIVIVAIDDRSLQELGGWPLKRAEYVKLLDRLDDSCCRPKAVGFDLLLLDKTIDDAALTEQVKRQSNVVLPLAFKVNEANPSALQATHPVSPLAEVATLGHINLSFDTDGVIRGFQPNIQTWPHFSLAVHAKGAQAIETSKHDSDYRRFRMVDPRVGFPVISLTDAIHSNISRTLLKDKYVLIGVTAPSLGDRYPTLHSGKNNASTPGVAILASVLNASINHTLIDEASPWITFGLTLVPLLLMLQSLVMLSPRESLGLALVMVFGSLLGSYLLLTFMDYWVDPTPFMLIALSIQPLWAWRRLEAIVHLIQGKAADFRELHPLERNNAPTHPSREVVLQHAKLLDHAVASARSELDFLSSIVDEMPEVVLIFDANDALLLSNQKTQQLFDAELSHGCHLMALTNLLNFPADTFENLINQTENSPQQVLIPLATKLGTRDFVLKTASLNAPLGRSLRLLLLMDITELRQSQKQRDRALQLLSHDMRTPVASILSLLPSQDRSNEKITQHAQSLLQMMDDFILTISSEATQYKVQSESLDNLINDSLEQVADLAHAKNICLSDESHTSHLFVMANTRLLVRAFVNLLFNAIKFSPSQSTIQIQSLHVESSETSSTQVTLVISNLVSAVCSEIDITQTLQGFGLGLDFVDTVIHKHQGTIERHIPAHGVATVVITLPCEISQIAL